MNKTDGIGQNCYLICSFSCMKQAWAKKTKFYRSIYKSDFDGCKQLEDAQPEYKEMIKMFGLPEHCPVSKVMKIFSKYYQIYSLIFSIHYLHVYISYTTKVNSCEDGSKKIDLNKYKHIFNLARGGAIRTEVEIQHDNVSFLSVIKSVFNFTLLLFSKGKSTFKSEFQITKNWIVKKYFWQKLSINQIYNKS